MTLQWSCTVCGHEAEGFVVPWRCTCGGPWGLRGAPGAIDPAALARRPATLWRYREALPLPPTLEPVSLGEGMTPLVPFPGMPDSVRVKLDFLCPTGSFKDRGAAVLINALRVGGITEVVEDSSGNAGAAMAAYCAAAGIRCHIFVPSRVSTGKLRQIRTYGAEVHLVPGSRERAATAAAAWARTCYYASHCWNPLFLEGAKTFSYELWEQLDRSAPGVVVSPVGHGTLLLGVYRGFWDLQNLGLIPRMPRIVGVQASRCAPLYRTWRDQRHELVEIRPSKTIAEGIAIRQPVRWREILAAVRETDGALLTVDERSIQRAHAAAAGRGLLIEPTAAVALAGYDEARRAGIIAGEDQVIIPLTGSGLKTL